MGGVAAGIALIVSAIGGVFATVINWFEQFKSKVNQITENKLNKKSDEILKCQEPKKVAKYLAAESHHKETKKIADDYKKDLTPGDLEKATRMAKEMNL